MLLQRPNPLRLFPSNAKTVNTKPKSAAEITKEVVLTSSRSGEPVTKRNSGEKNRADKLLLVRDAIGNLFSGSKLFTEWKDSVKANQLMNNDVLKEKFGSYDDEFGRLHKAVQDTFRLSGRPDLADSFGTTVPLYREGLHPIDFIATLLKGAGDPLAQESTDNQYKILAPFKTMMQDVLTSKGIAAPNNMSTLAQIFYNTFVAQDGSANPVMNFDTMKPSDLYHADEAVVNGIVSFVKTLADKKQAGEQLSPLQDKIANIGLKVQSNLTTQATNQVNQTIGEKITTNSKTILIVIGVLVVIIAVIAFRKM